MAVCAMLFPEKVNLAKFFKEVYDKAHEKNASTSAPLAYSLVAELKAQAFWKNRVKQFANSYRNSVDLMSEMAAIMEDCADMNYFKEELECIEDFNYMKKAFDLGERLRDHAVPGSYAPFLVKLGDSMRAISTNHAAPGDPFTSKVQELLHRANSVIPSVANWTDMSNAIEKREKEQSVKEQVTAFTKTVSELQSSVGESANVDIPLVKQVFSR
eukprot:8447957-Pyramimonas_sp.AAC.1